LVEAFNENPENFLKIFAFIGNLGGKLLAVVYISVPPINYEARHSNDYQCIRFAQPI
jgi:hypothetical protein